MLARGRFCRSAASGGRHDRWRARRTTHLVTAAAVQRSNNSGSSTSTAQQARAQPERAATQIAAANSIKRTVIVQTTNQAVLTAAVEAGYGEALFDAATAALGAQWQALASFTALQLQPDGSIITGPDQQQVGRLQVVSSKADLQAAEAGAKQDGYLIMDATDWKVIPAENLVAAFQPGPGRLLGVAGSAADARVMLEALEAGTAGVLLRTEDPVQVKQLAAYLSQREAEGEPAFKYNVATVTRVVPVGMGDRVCVDLCSLLHPGEGMLVGSFARALFLVHSECMESAYINSRPFRVNAGAVHAYVQAPADRTAYLSELKSGAEVLVADAAGRTRTAVVGRCKIEVRPMMLVEAETEDGAKHSTLLQNAETVRLVGPGVAQPSRPSQAATTAAQPSQAPGGQRAWQAVSVSALQPGQEVFVLLQEGARHTGISIQERISEK